MKFWVGVTDKDWFDFLRRLAADEVNFWQPSSVPLARFLEPGVPFLFKLHSPDNFVVGGGYFVRFSALPASLAWDAFGQNNGTETYSALLARVSRYRRSNTKDPEIGCNILNQPFFLEQRDWIPIPETWASNIVRGRHFDTGQEDGSRLWGAVCRALDREVPKEAVMDPPRFGTEYLTHARLGQGAFRILVTDAYRRRCAITGERTLPVLEAAHIRPYAEEGPHLTANGLLLRSDLHTLFDRGYITVTEDLRVEVSARIRAEFENGREYYKHHGAPLQIEPGDKNDRPAGSFLRWHNENRYNG